VAGKILFVLCTIPLIFGWLQPANSTTIANGDFANGLSDWTISNPDGLPAGIISVDIDGSGPLNASNAFFAQTGGGYESSGVSILQSIGITDNGEYTLSANIAASYFPNDSRYINNLSGGVITAAWNGTIVDLFDFGEISANSWEYATLSASFLASSSGILDITFFRPFASDINSPINYVSNVSLAFDKGFVAPVPEPSTVLLIGTGIIGITAFGRKILMKLYPAN
jgi:hypothetical protein